MGAGDCVDQLVLLFCAVGLGCCVWVRVGGPDPFCCVVCVWIADVVACCLLDGTMACCLVHWWIEHERLVEHVVDLLLHLQLGFEVRDVV